MDDAREYRVLVVEDDANHRLLISMAFQNGNPLARVTHTVRADEAVAYLMEARARLAEGRPGAAAPDVIVLDINMPGISGLGLLKWAASQPDWIRTVPIIVFSSSDDLDLAVTCMALGAKEFVEKPLDFGELVDVTNRVLADWKPEAPRSRSPASRPDPRTLRVWNLATALGFEPGTIERLILEFDGNEEAVQTVIEWAHSSKVSLAEAAEEITIWDSSAGLRRFIYPDERL